MRRPVRWGWLAIALFASSAFGDVEIATKTLPAGTVGTAYNASLSATGTQAPFVWSGTAPAGLTLSSAGVVSGTPNTSGNMVFLATVKNSENPPDSDTQSISLKINPVTLSVTTSPLPAGTVGSMYSATLGAMGGTAPYTFSAGGLPGGLNVSGS